MAARFRSKNVCWTLNNPTVEETARIHNLIPERCVYGVCQLEVGANGTLHLQGYCVSDRRHELQWWRDTISQRAHFENARGNHRQNRDYCTKDDTRVEGTVPFEHGELPADRGGRGRDFGAALGVMRERGPRALVEEDPDMFVQFGRGLLTAFGYTCPRRDFKTVVVWCYGRTGTGKSRWAHERYPDAYCKSVDDKWWDHYSGEEVVIVDDYRCSFSTFNELLRLTDRYGHPVPFKGGYTQFRSRRLIFTSPRSPMEMWAGRTEEDLAQLRRRIDHIAEFPLQVANFSEEGCECTQCAM